MARSSTVIQRVPCTRRSFLHQSSAVISALAVTRLAAGQTVHVAGSDVLRLGLIGCGGRGSGAVINALTVDAQTKLVAMADAFAWRIDESLQSLLALKPEQIDVPPERRFVGLDAYQHLLACDVDVVLIAVPSHFVPIYLQAAVDAGKHVFCEKTHAVDAPGVRSVLQSAETARQKGLSIVSGLAWRYDTGVRETMQRVHDGAIGDITSIQEVCNTGSLRSLPRKPGMTEMEYQIYNWYDFNWLSADLPGLNLVHNVDKGAWALHDAPPLSAWGMGGREVRKGPTFGDVFDHHATVFRYPDGVQMYAYCRQINGATTDISDVFIGTRGRCDLLQNKIEGEVTWRYEGPPCNRFDLEQAALLSSIRAGTPINNGLYMARSSLLALMATWCSHTGEEITWDQALNSQRQVNPERYALDAPPPVLPDADGNYPIAVPGTTRFA
ncbi:MAG: Gfo/Idh/MocA family oxidoreductase [Planctomycetaceae bacterium]|nr:Gfo/Idh/MocA family oxidoreductase [Planctomycetaceae bacterium]